MTRPETVNRITTNLDWIRTTGPDHIAAIATEQATLDAHAPRPQAPTLTAGTGDRGYRIGHADPTANATRTTPTPAIIDHLDRHYHAIHAQARNLNHHTATALHHQPTHIAYEPDRYGLISNAIAYLPLGHQLDQAANHLHGHDLTRLDWMLRDLDERALLVATRAATILDATPRAAANPAVQRKLIVCTSHARFNGPSGRPLEEPTDAEYGSHQLCNRCGRFQKRYKFLPDEPMIRAWEYRYTTPSTLDVERARRASKVKPGRNRVA